MGESDTVSAAAVENLLELSGGLFMWNKVSHRTLFDLSQNDAIKIPSD